MKPIPKPALLLGLGGVLPFAAPALASLIGVADPLGLGWAPYLLGYGLTILSFMSGCVWAFAARTEDALGYGLSTLPALYGAALLLLAIPSGLSSERQALFALAAGFAALMILDWRAARRGQTPEWWMKLRILLTSLVIVCLVIGAST